MKVIKSMIEKYKRPSVIVFILAIILGLSAIAVPIFSIQNLMKSLDAGKSITAFGNICNQSKATE